MRIHLYRKNNGLSPDLINFKGDLNFFLLYVESELESYGFNSLFNHFCFRFNYYLKTSIPKTNIVGDDYLTYYQSLPLIKIDRRYKYIYIDLQSDGFNDFHDFFEKNISLDETNFIKFILSEIISKIDLLRDQIKKSELFDLDLFIKVLVSIREKINQESLLEIYKVQKQVLQQKEIQYANELRNKRASTIKENNTLLRDLRFYVEALPIKAFYPYSNIYIAIFKNLLMNEDFLCPNYHHLYINVAETYELALRKSVNYENWYFIGIAVIDYDLYLKSDTKGKEQIVFKAILDGLRDIAKIDRLDLNIIERVALKIQEKGMDTDLFLDFVENKKYSLEITYFARGDEEQCPIFFNLTDKSIDKTYRIQLLKSEISQLFYWISNVKITNTKIKIKSSTSAASQVYLMGKPKKMEFDIEELIKYGN